MGSSAIVKVPEQVGAAKSAGNRVPGKVPGRSFLLRENPSGQPDRHDARLGTGFPARGSQARFPGTGSQARFPRTGFQEKVADKVSKNRFASKGFPGNVPGNRFPSKVRKTRFPSKVRKNRFVPKRGSQE